MNCTNNTMFLEAPVKKWQYLGIALSRGPAGSYDSDITGDPCIVWDEKINRYRMFYFALNRSVRSSNSCNAQALSASENKVAAGNWEKIGPVEYTNPSLLLGGHTHKPWILMDPFRPNRAAKVNGFYMLFTVSYLNESKAIQMAVSESLQGPWTISPEPVLLPGKHNEFDGYHVDTVTAYWFEDRKEILIFYKGYPAEPQKDQLLSPWGSSLCAAVMKQSDSKAQKLGKIITPSLIEEHWLSGWVSGIQLFPARKGGWYGLMTGSPTPPVSVQDEPRVREPAPSLAGWAYTPQAWPTIDWRTSDEPIWYLEDIPFKAAVEGMGVNLWRHHMLVLNNGDKYLYCNSGSYGNERMFVRKASDQESEAK